MKKYLLLLLTLIIAPNLSVSADTISGIEDGFESDKINITYEEKYDVFIDGLSYETNTVYSEIGHHTLTMYEGDTLVEEVSFTIHPEFKYNVILDDFVGEYIRINLRNQEGYVLQLNGQVRENNFTLSEVGYYTLNISGANNYERDYSFTIEDQDFLDMDLQSYASFVYVSLNHYEKVYVNYEQITEDTTLTDYGSYRVTVYGVGGYVKSVEFIRDISDNQIENNKVYDQKITISVSNTTKVLIDGVEISKATTIDEVGYHTVVIEGIHGFIKTFNITVKEKSISTKDGFVVDKFIVGDIGGNLYLNGEPYKANTEITNIGNYTFTVKGLNGYKKSINFKIRNQFPIEDGEVLENPVNLSISAETISVNGIGVKQGYRIYKTGTYEVKVYGPGGYYEAFTVSYTNPNDQFVPYFNYLAFGLLGIVTITYGIVLWRRFK